MAKLDQAWTVEAHHGGSAIAAELHRHMGVSHRQAKGLIDARCVLVNGEAATKYGHRLEPGNAIKVVYDPALKYDPLPALRGVKDNSFTTLWEDTHLLFVDKPAGLLTVPAETGGEPSLADAVADHYRRRGQKHAQLYIVHRLDRFTSGVLVFARTPEALHHLKKLFAMHKLQRTYRAILVGELPENQGTLKGHLIEQAKTLKMRVVDPKRKDTEGSQSAVTHYRVVERLPGHTVVEVELETGRRNQIRVQFADRGFPLLGDHVYGEVSELLDRQALHAEVLGVKHPITEAMVLVKAPLPKDFESALKALRGRTRLVRAAAGEKGEVVPLKTAKAPSKKPLDRMSPGDRPRFAKPGARPSARTPGAGAGARAGARPAPGKKPFRPRPDEGAAPRADRPRAPRSEGGAPRHAAGADRPRTPRREEGSDRPRPKSFEDRPRTGSGRPAPRGPRAEGRPESRPESRPAGRSEERPRRDFDTRSPRTGAPDRPRRESGAVTGPRGSKPAYKSGPRSGSKPGKPGGKSGPKASGARKPFTKKRG